MTKVLFIPLLFGLLFIPIAAAQKENDSLVLNLHLKFGKQNLVLDKKYISENKDTLTLDLVKFYISGISVLYSDKTVFKSKNKGHLVSIENLNSQRISIYPKKNTPIETVFFNIGLDSLTSVSGALSGDLDPEKGMYWAWQSGYINMKIEGQSSSCLTRKNRFQFHIGGYLKPNYAIRKVTLSPMQTVSNSTIDINVDVAVLFLNMELSKTNSVMIPGKPAMEMADDSVKMFYLTSYNSKEKEVKIEN